MGPLRFMAAGNDSPEISGLPLEMTRRGGAIVIYDGRKRFG